MCIRLSNERPDINPRRSFFTTPSHERTADWVDHAPPTLEQIFAINAAGLTYDPPRGLVPDGMGEPPAAPTMEEYLRDYCPEQHRQLAANVAWQGSFVNDPDPLCAPTSWN